MSKAITEEMGIHKDWYVEARNMTPDNLGAFITKLTGEYQHDYGTICHAASAAAVAAAWAVDKSPQGGITGFQAGEIMWGFIIHWMSELDGKPARLVNYADMLYPQYEGNFDKVISKETHEFLVEQAKNKLKDQTDAGPRVIAHWERIASGEVPFGYRVAADT